MSEERLWQQIEELLQSESLELSDKVWSYKEALARDDIEAAHLMLGEMMGTVLEDFDKCRQRLRQCLELLQCEQGDASDLKGFIAHKRLEAEFIQWLKGGKK